MHRVLGFPIAVVFVVLCSSISRAQAPDLLYLKLNEGMGNVSADAAIPGLLGTNPVCNDSLSWVTSDPFLGSAAFHPATTGVSFLNLGSSFSTAGSDYTFEFAIRPRSTPNSPYQQYFFGGQSSASPRFSLKEIFPGESQVWAESSGGMVGSRRTIPHDVWTFVSIVFDDSGNEIRFYFDGELVDSFGVWAPLTLYPGGNWQLGFSPVFNGLFFEGDLDEFRLWGTERSESFIRMLSRHEISSRDLGIGELVAPYALGLPGQSLGVSEVVSVEVINGGTTAIPLGSLLPVTLGVDGTVVAVEGLLLTAALPPGGSVVHNFAATVDLSAAGLHDIEISVDDPLDTGPGNNDRCFKIGRGGPGATSRFPSYEPFDDSLTLGSTMVPLGWGNTPVVGPPWLVQVYHLMATGGAGGGRTPGSFFMSAIPPVGVPTISTAELTTCAYDLQETMLPRCQFWMHNKTPSGTTASGLPHAPSHLEIDVIQHDPLVVVTNYLSSSQLPTATNGWERQVIDLSPFAGKLVQLRFRAQLQDAIISIDEVGISDAAPSGSGQAPRSGQATLDVANTWGMAAEASGYLGVSSAAPGPFWLEHVLGNSGGYGTAFVTVTGAPNQPILFLRGRPNLASADFGAIGQMDIGGFIDPLTGIPGHLVVAGNGFAPVFNHDFYCSTSPSGQVVLPTFFPGGFLGWTWGLQALVGSPNAPHVLLTNAVFALGQFN